MGNAIGILAVDNKVVELVTGGEVFAFAFEEEEEEEEEFEEEIEGEYEKEDVFMGRRGKT